MDRQQCATITKKSSLLTPFVGSHRAAPWGAGSSEQVYISLRRTALLPQIQAARASPEEVPMLRRAATLARRASTVATRSPPAYVADARALLLHRPSCAPPPSLGAPWSPGGCLLRLCLDGPPASPPDRPPMPPLEDASAALEITMPGGLSGARPHPPHQLRRPGCLHHTASDVAQG